MKAQDKENSYAQVDLLKAALVVVQAMAMAEDDT